MNALEALIVAERRRQGPLLLRAALFAALVAAASVTLLGLSGWFITAAAIAGAAGPAAAQVFNYMLPSAGIRFLAIVRTGARYGERLASHAAAFHALARIRPALFRALAAAPAERALAVGAGDATARLVSDVDAIETRFVRLSTLWAIAAALCSGVAMTLIGGIGPALATIGWLGLLLLIGDRLSRQMVEPGRELQRAVGKLRQTFGGMADAAAELRCFDLEDWAAERVEQSGHQLAAAQRRQADAASWFELLHATAVGAAAASALLLSIHAGPAVAALAALTAAMTVDAAGPALRLMADRGQLEEAQIRLEQIFAVSPALGATTEISTAPTIRFLVPVPWEVRPGARLALVGPSGVGKTSLVETLLGLRQSMGQVMLDGVDCSDINLDDLRGAFAWAPQDASLIAGTVRDNLLLANCHADEEVLQAALHDAAVDGVVARLDHGMDSWIGENGVRLSGGERRRLSLARAYCARAPWLLLDEPSEGLDAETEALVAQRLAARLERTGQGLILVSHCPGLTALCDQMLVLRPEPAAPDLKIAA